MHRAAIATEVTRAGITGMRGDVVERQRRTAHQLLRSIKPELAENRLRTRAARLPEQPAEMTRRNVNRVRDFLHRRTLGQVLDVPGNRSEERRVGKECRSRCKK